jgi:glycosyltransferase involved in cell wall biosynthesis
VPLLSIVIPVYNEVKTIKEILARIYAVPVDKEIIVVDDGSSDGTDKVLRDLRYDNLKVIHHTTNRGKGAAFLTGLSHASGDLVIIQDADLEYSPEEYPKLLSAFREQGAELLLGARFTRGYSGLFLHQIGNRFLTGLLNLVFGSHLNDFETCYKLALRSTWQELGLKGTGFNIDAEIVCNALKKKKRILEVPVSYHPRTYREGKKIRWGDGLLAIFYIVKYRFTNP